MNEILSFAELFAEAKRSNLRVNSFSQDKDGVFIANWRRDLKSTTMTAKFFDVARHEQPFLALLNAFVLADLGTPAQINDSADLFG